MPYDPENVESFAIGGKFTLLDRRLRLNIAAFRAAYAGMQLPLDRQHRPFERAQRSMADAERCIVRQRSASIFNSHITNKILFNNL